MTIQSTVRVVVTMEMHYAQPFGPEWKLDDVHTRALKDAHETAQRWASEFKQGRAVLLKVDPNITIVMHEQK